MIDHIPRLEGYRLGGYWMWLNPLLIADVINGGITGDFIDRVNMVITLALVLIALAGCGFSPALMLNRVQCSIPLFIQESSSVRGEDIFQESLFTTIQLETFVSADHPLRPIRALLDEAMNQLSWLFDSIYAAGGRESIPAERLIRAQLLQVLYSIRSERQLPPVSG